MELKPITHKERKEYKKKFSAIGAAVTSDNPVKIIDEFNDYREQFLKDHLVDQSIDLDSMTAKEVDKLCEKLEAEMDFFMGLGKKAEILNTAPTRAAQSIPLPESTTSTQPTG